MLLPGRVRSRVIFIWSTKDDLTPLGFEPKRVAAIPDEELEALLKESRIIRHWGEIKATRHNAAALAEIAAAHGGFGAWLADWPADDTVGMWLLLKKRGKQLGGNSGAAFLRMVGRDTWYPTGDVVAALKAQNIIDKPPRSQRDQKAVQAAFNTWQAESGRPQAHISKVLAFTIG